MTLAAEILLVEDNPADVKLTRLAFKDCKLINNLHVVTDGAEAIDFLRQRGKHEAAARPDLILLDLNLPKKNGREVLHEIKSDESLRLIPVIILTSSEDEKDILETYNTHANSFITKPVELDGFIKIVSGLENFWFSIVKLPPRE